ncbi:MAG: surface lipoprotein assembly modifier [Boseongicola sp.]|nr:surface lipoprotein assembly modifier [Boseongicola sp.]
MHIPVSALAPILAVALHCLSATAVQGSGHDTVPQPDTSAGTPVPVSAESDLNAAVSLLHQGEIDAAIDTVRPHLPRDLRAVDLLFDAGMFMLGSAQTTPPSDASGRAALLDASIALFRAILAEHPDFARARLELAHAFFLRGRDGLARRHFERALAADPPAPVAANINRFLAEIRARKRWSGYFGMALLPDTNIGAASASETVLLDFFGQRLPFTLDDGGEQSGIGLSVWAGGEYQEPLVPNWFIRIGGDISRREYSSSKFDGMNLGGHVGPRWLIGPRTEASLLFTARREWQADRPSRRSLGVRLEALRRLTPRVSGQFGASWSARRHDESTYLNGPALDLSVGLTWSVSPTLRANLRTGWSRARTELESLRNRTFRTSLGASIALPRGFNVSGTLSGSWTDYKGPGRPPSNVVDGSPRKDVTRSIRLSVLKRDLTIGNFSPQFSVTHERRGSNAQQADYRRTGGEISFVRQF